MNKYENVYTRCRCMDDGKRKYIRNANGKNGKVKMKYKIYGKIRRDKQN